MKIKLVGILFVTCCVAALALPVLAHHSFTAEFDIYKPVIVEGTITKLDWINPHIQMYITAPGAGGKAAEDWQIESWGTLNMHHAGVTKEKLAIGTPVKIRAYHAKDGTKNFAYMRNISFKDGSEYELWTGGAEGSPDQQR